MCGPFFSLCLQNPTIYSSLIALTHIFKILQSVEECLGLSYCLPSGMGLWGVHITLHIPCPTWTKVQNPHSVFGPITLVGVLEWLLSTWQEQKCRCSLCPFVDCGEKNIVSVISEWSSAFIKSRAFISPLFVFVLSPLFVNELIGVSKFQGCLLCCYSAPTGPRWSIFLPPLRAFLRFHFHLMQDTGKSTHILSFWE